MGRHSAVPIIVPHGASPKQDGCRHLRMHQLDRSTFGDVSCPSSQGLEELPPCADESKCPPMNEPATKRLNRFERYLTLWVGLCMVGGVLLGKLAPAFVAALRSLEFGAPQPDQSTHRGAHLAHDLPDDAQDRFRQHRGAAPPARRHSDHAVRQLVGQAVLDGPARMDFLQTSCSRRGSARRWRTSTSPGAIILAAAPCTAMVFVWSYLTDGDPAYTLVQVSLNDLIMLVLFAPIVGLLVAGASSLRVPFQVLHVQCGGVHRDPARARKPEPHRAHACEGTDWFERVYQPAFQPVTRSRFSPRSC